MKISNIKNEFGATLSNKISQNDFRIESMDSLVGDVRDREIAATTKNLYRLLLDENLEHLDYKVFTDEMKYLPKGAIASLSPTTLLENRFANRGCDAKSIVKTALEKITRIEIVVKNNDASIVSSSFRIGNEWIVKTCNILIFDSWKYDRETNRMVVWPDEQKFELGWQIVDQKEEQEEAFVF